MQEWRFDQGRLAYFQIDEIKKIACAVASIDGLVKPTVDADTIRQILSHHSTLLFLPANYTVWRNYGRVFSCMMLATEFKGRIYATDLCKLIASDPDAVDSDDYLAHFTRHFYYSSPIFEGYTNSGPQIFPGVAVIKFLIAKYLLSGKNYVTLDEITSYLVANKVTGLEDLNFYSSITPSASAASTDIRQIRELVKVISQFSFLKWDNPNLYLEVKDREELFSIEAILKPNVNPRDARPEIEILRMGEGFSPGTIGDVTSKNMESLEEQFTEGRKVRVTHLRTERSSKLRDLYFSTTKIPEICNMCNVDTSKKYPWTQHVIELHHLLPLSSPVRVEGSSTSIKDLVGLCPTCHRATHRYYSGWFKKNSLFDFRSYEEAKGVYGEACKAFRI